MLFTLLTVGMFGGMIVLVLYELVQEMQGSKHKLIDRYHD